MDQIWQKYGKAATSIIALTAIGYIIIKGHQIQEMNPQTLTAAASMLLAAYVLARSKTPEILRGELEAARMKCDRFDEENKQLKEALHKQEITIRDLQAKTDLSRIEQTQHQILGALGDVAKTMDTVAKTLERITNILPLATEIARNAPPR